MLRPCHYLPSCRKASTVIRRVSLPQGVAERKSNLTSNLLSDAISVIYPVYPCSNVLCEKFFGLKWLKEMCISKCTPYPHKLNRPFWSDPRPLIWFCQAQLQLKLEAEIALIFHISKTSSARSATLGDASWARLIIKLAPSFSVDRFPLTERDYCTYKIHKKANLWLHLTSWNLPNSQLCLEPKRKPSVA